MGYDLAVLLLATVGVCSLQEIHINPGQTEIGDHPNEIIISRPPHNLGLRCPSKAVCANVFDFVRDFENGTVIPERRIVHHCLCEGDTMCPLDPEHRLYDSEKTREYFCQPVSLLPSCDLTNSSHVSKEVVEMDLDFSGYIYSRVLCTCPRHWQPLVGSGRMALATLYRRTKPDFVNNRFVQFRSCVL